MLLLHHGRVQHWGIGPATSKHHPARSHGHMRHKRRLRLRWRWCFGPNLRKALPIGMAVFFRTWRVFAGLSASPILVMHLDALRSLPPLLLAQPRPTALHSSWSAHWCLVLVVPSSSLVVQIAVCVFVHCGRVVEHKDIRTVLRTTRIPVRRALGCSVRNARWKLQARHVLGCRCMQHSSRENARV